MTNTGFKFKSTKLSFPILNENDEVIKNYTLDFSNKDFLREAMKSGKEALQRIENVDKDNLDNAEESLKVFIDLVFGDGEFDFLYKNFENNFFAMVELMRAVTELMQEKIAQKTSAYV